MAHGGTNFGFYNGANTGQNESDYKGDITSYDYVRNLWAHQLTIYWYFACILWFICLHLVQDAPIRESGDVNNAKFNGKDISFLLISAYHLCTFISKLMPFVIGLKYKPKIYAKGLNLSLYMFQLFGEL